MKISHRVAQTVQSSNHDLLQLHSHDVEITRSPHITWQPVGMSSQSCGITGWENEEKEKGMTMRFPQFVSKGTLF